MSKVTYARLDEVLRSVGFAMRGVVDRNKVYRHEETGALIVFPEFPPDSEVLPRYISQARAVLKTYGLMDEMDFAVMLHNGA
jgi:hypothetical protein